MPYRRNQSAFDGRLELTRRFRPAADVAGGTPSADRPSQSFLLLCRHALESGVPAGHVIALLDGAKRAVFARGAPRDGRSVEDAEPTIGTSESPVEGD